MTFCDFAGQQMSQDNGLKSFQTLLGVLWFLSILQVAKGSWPNFITRY